VSTSPGVELARRGLHALRRSTTWWAIGIAAFGLVNIAFWPSLEQSDSLASLEDVSGDLLEAFGAQNLSSPAGYLDGQMFALMLPLLLSGMAIAMVSGLTAGDEDAGRLELLHALPVARRAVWLSRFGSVALASAVVGLVVTGVTLVSVAVFSLDGVGAGRVAAATFACVALGAFHAAVAYLLAGLGRSRGQSAAGAVLVLVVGYLVSFVLPLADSLRDARRFSPWWWAIGEQPVSSGVDLWSLLVLVAVSALLVAGGTLAVEHRDIRSA
jgi:ABC-2 type transport system permease protein